MSLPTPPRHINPLWVIFLFFSSTEMVLSIGVLNTTSPVQIILTWFVVVFPAIIAIVFFVFLWFKPLNFYSPRDYSEEGNFIKAMKAGEADAKARKLVQGIGPEIQQTVHTTFDRLDDLFKNDTVDLKQGIEEAKKTIKSNIIDRTFITISFKEFAKGVEDLILPVTAYKNFSSLLNDIYFNNLSSFVEPYTYGTEWVLVNEKNEKIESARMINHLPAGKPVKDSRSLKKVGIIPGMKLEIIRP